MLIASDHKGVLCQLGLGLHSSGVKMSFNAHSTLRLLHYCGKGSAVDVQTALDDGADPDAVSEDGGLPAVALAAQDGSVDVLEALGAAGARFDAVGHHGITALHQAALYGHLRAVKFLCEDAERCAGGAASRQRAFRVLTLFGCLANTSPLLLAVWLFV